MSTDKTIKLSQWISWGWIQQTCQTGQFLGDLQSGLLIPDAIVKADTKSTPL